MKKHTKIFIVVLLSLFTIGVAGWGYLRSHSQTATPTALKVAKTAQAEDQALVFPSKQKNTPVVIFYPGALVQPESYSQWASKVAAAGFPVYIMHFPLDLAVLAPNRAAQVLDQTDRDYVIGGHSLGGVMASRFARSNSKRLQGVFFQASYPDQKGSLKKSHVSVLSLTASRDGVLDWDRYRTAKQYLPKNTVYQTIQGGNHAGFGSYGHQKGDRQATISNQKQQQQVARLLIAWLQQLT